MVPYNQQLGKEKLDKGIKTYLGDLNDIDTKGIEIVYTGTETTNKPEVTNGYCITLATSVTYKKQIYYNQTDTNISFERTCNNGIWTEWVSKQQTITSGTEYETGRIIDGKKEYAKRFAAIALPSSASNTNIKTGLTNINFIKLEGSISKTDGSENSNLPWSYTGQPNVYHYYSNVSKNITIRVSGDMSNYQVVETIYYTKN